VQASRRVFGHLEPGRTLRTGSEKIQDEVNCVLVVAFFFSCLDLFCFGLTIFDCVNLDFTDCGFVVFDLFFLIFSICSCTFLATPFSFTPDAIRKGVAFEITRWVQCENKVCKHHAGYSDTWNRVEH
jgi:hypothetical protein